ncbi:MAG: PGF-CTERM sorting domain-containing protein [Archaeoglobaceae archaeon]
MNGKFVIVSIGLILAISLVIPFFVNISAEEEPPEREYVRLERMDIRAEEVNISHASIEFLVGIDRSEVVSNATLSVGVYDEVTGLLLETQEIEVPRDGVEGSGELNVSMSLEKSRDYNIEFSLEKDNSIVDSKGMELSGMDTLVPEGRELKLSMRDVDFEITGVQDNMTDVKTRFYMDTTENYSEVTFHVKAVQFESNVMAEDSWLTMEVNKGKTLLVETNLTVPSNYNYVVDLEAWREDSLLKSWSRGLNLAPTERVPENVSEEKVRFRASEFIRQTPSPPAPTPEPTEGRPQPQPGFEAVLALLAIGGVFLWKKRKKN